MASVVQYKSSMGMTRRKPAPDITRGIQNKWTPEREAALEELFALKGGQYLNLREIAARMNSEHKMQLTRNAVSGKADRMGLADKYPRADALGGLKQRGKRKPRRRMKPEDIRAVKAINRAIRDAQALPEQHGSGGVMSIAQAKPDGHGEPAAMRDGHGNRVSGNTLAEQPVHQAPSNASLAPSEPTKSADMSIAHGQGVPLVDAQWNQCRWPLPMRDGVSYCCGTIIGDSLRTRPKPYCVEHARASTDRPRTIAADSHRKAQPYRDGAGRSAGVGKLNRFR